MSSDSAWIDHLIAESYSSELADLEANVAAGDSESLLEALWLITQPNVAVPNWLAQRIGRAVMKYRSHKVRTLDEAFGVSRPKGYQTKSNRERWQKAPLIVFDVLALHAHGISIGDGMFEALAELHGIGKTRAGEYFYFHKDRKTQTYLLAIGRSHPVLRPELVEIATSLMPPEM